MLIWPMLALGFFVEPAGAQINQCLTQAEIGSSWVASWESFKDYINSLTTSKATRDRARLFQLRSKITDIEAEKRLLIDIVEAHASGTAGQTPATGAAQGRNISAVQIPDILMRITELLSQLEKLVENTDPFVAEDAFRQLKVQLSSERIGTVCELSDAMMQQQPNQNLIIRLLANLKMELEAIERANQELGLYLESMP